MYKYKMAINIYPLCNEVLDNIDMSKIKNDAHGDVGYISNRSGAEHYRLLTHIASINSNKKFIDLGTYMGWSALALASNPANKVISYDITQHFIKEEKHLKPNLTYKIKNFLNDLEELEGTDLILLDIDPHDGIQEKQMIEKLIELNYKGVVLMDDVYVGGRFHELSVYFQSIPLRKENLTRYGHVTGTGIVYFD